MLRYKWFSVLILLLGVFTVPAFSQLGIFDTEVDYPQLAEFKMDGGIHVTGSGDNTLYVIQGNGMGLGDSDGQDEGYYVYKEQSGSWSLQGRVKWLDPEGLGPWGSVGLMIREVAEIPTSRHYSILLREGESGSNTAVRDRNLRGFPGLPTFDLVNEAGEPVAGPGEGLWLRLSFVDPLDLFIAEYSRDGLDWIVGNAQILPWGAESLAYGLFIANDEEVDYLSFAEFDHVSFLSPAPVAERSISQASFKSNDTISVFITVFNQSDSPQPVTIDETPPAGWTLSGISNGGSGPDGVITWSMEFPSGETVLSYQATAPAAPQGNTAEWSGRIEGGLDIQGKTGLLFSEGNIERSEDGLLVLYTFEEGEGTVVHDVSGVGDPLDLTIRDPSLVEWGPASLTVSGTTKIKSGVPAAKIIEQVYESWETTIEAWIAPSNTVQSGPARIITLSDNPSNRNFTLGQQGTEYHVRYRTDLTTNNGIPALESGEGTLSTVLTHVVYTRNEFWDTFFYINGELIIDNDTISELIDGDPYTWDESYELGLANEINEERPWLGEFYLVAIYGRAISEEEVIQNFTAGPGVTTDIENWQVY